MDALLQDLRYAVRRLRRSPGFTVIAVVIIALGIGATTTIFSAVNSALLKPPPGVRDAGELVRVYRVAEDGSSYHELSFPTFEAYRAAETGLTDLAATSLTSVVLMRAEESEPLLAVLVSQEFLGMLGVRPAMGRFFLPEEDRTPGTHLVAVLSHGTWKQRFGGDPSIIGRTVTLNRRQFTVIGVTEEGFRGPNSLLGVEIWLPMHAAPALNENIDMDSRAMTWLDGYGRLGPGVTLDRVSAELHRVNANLKAAYPDGNPDHGVDVQRYAPISRQALGPALAFSLFLFVVSGGILLIACLNVGSMVLARASRRGKEMATRLALGAGRGRVVRQLLTENVLLFTLGGAGGVLVTLYVTRLLGAFQLPVDVPVVFDFSPDVRVFAFSLVVAVLTGAIFGLAPAFRVTKSGLQTMMKGDAGAAGGVRSRLRSAFVVAQVAGSAVLLIGAGLFARGLARSESVDLGFEPDGVQALSTDLEPFGYDADEAAAFYRDLLEGASRSPEVVSAALVGIPPVTFGGQESRFAVDGEEVMEDEGPTTDFARVSPGYFETLRIPLAEGRSLTSTDRMESTPVAIVNQTFASRSWPGESAVGRRVRLDQLGMEFTVVGVAENAKYRTLTEEPRSMVYVAYDQQPVTSMVLLARTRAGDGTVASSLRQIALGLDDGIHVDANLPYNQLMGIARLPSRVAAILSTIFGVLGLVLASFGLYGALAFMVAQRTREIGIRIALGAGPGHVRGQVLRDGIKLAGIGLIVGYAIAFGATRLLRGLLFGLSPTDPVTYGGIAVVLVSVAVGASLVPALRASRSDPVEALRAE